MEPLVKKLKKFVELNGAAKTAYILGMRDTNALKKWISRKVIPKNKVEMVKEMIKCEK